MIDDLQIEESLVTILNKKDILVNHHTESYYNDLIDNISPK